MNTFIKGYAGKTVVAVGAHPDDLEISMGGTLALLAEAGARVIMTVLAVPNDLTIRRREAEDAAAILGARLEVLQSDRCMRVEDMRMSEIVGRLDNIVRDYQPSAIFTHSVMEFHDDHLRTHQAVLSTLRIKPTDVYFFCPSTCKPNIYAWQPRIWVNVSSTIEKKIASIAAHKSQFCDRQICIEHFREQARSRGLPMGLEYAEGLDLLCAVA